MGKKYIIEIPEDKIADFVGSTHFLMPYMMAGHMGSHDTGLPIEPYTKPDLEQFGKEAYDKGYHDGHNVCYENAKDLMEEKKNEAYQHGLADAWEAARKIALMDTETSENVTGYFGLFRIMDNLTASEAIAKIKEYEDGKQEIKVGDEVERILDGEVDSKAVFLEENKGYYHCLFWTGSFFTTLSYPKKQFRKTGRHFPEIAAVLEKMRGEQNVPETD